MIKVLILSFFVFTAGFKVNSQEIIIYDSLKTVYEDKTQASWDSLVRRLASKYVTEGAEFREEDYASFRKVYSNDSSLLFYELSKGDAMRIINVVEFPETGERAVFFGNMEAAYRANMDLVWLT